MIPLGFINGEIEIMTTNNLLLTESTLNSITVHCDKYVFLHIICVRMPEGEILALQTSFLFLFLFFLLY